MMGWRLFKTKLKVGDSEGRGQAVYVRHCDQNWIK